MLRTHFSNRDLNEGYCINTAGVRPKSKYKNSVGRKKEEKYIKEQKEISKLKEKT
ncbi:hypothetical protein ACDZ29_28145 (plasmid) [Peribacillus sp. RS7]|uniref:hypothetical protein n=1 Tax=Peribacillus sp. RS7 TaxID=3242679 RepID=UPI0035C0DE8B